MSRTVKLGLSVGAAVIVLAIAGFWFVHIQDARAKERQVHKIGADWAQTGLLAESDYVRLHGIADSVVATRTVSDTDLDWLLLMLEKSQNSVPRARILGVISTLSKPPSAQKTRIALAVSPLLNSKAPLDRSYAGRVQRNLGIH